MTRALLWSITSRILTPILHDSKFHEVIADVAQRLTKMALEFGSINSNAGRSSSPSDVKSYFLTLSALLYDVSVTDISGRSHDFTNVAHSVVAQARAVHNAGNKLIFIGNGGSAAIASHMATDYSKCGNVRATTLNDASMLTCLSNDLGYDKVFARQIELHARPGDLLIAISSSGRSANILSAVAAGRAAGCAVLTLSGFTPDNPLRRLGDMNFYLASDRYGFVEIGHLTLCHAILDLICGLPPSPVDDRIF